MQKLSANSIIERIRQDALSQAQDVMEAAKMKAKAAADAIVAEGEARAKQIASRAQGDCDEAHRRVMLMAKLDTRKDELAKKRAVIDEAYVSAAQKLSDLPPEAWYALIESIVLEGTQTGEELLLVPKKDREKYTNAYLSELNAKLVAKGCKGALKLDDADAPIDDGVVLVSETYEINGSFDAVLRFVRETTEREVASMLFSTEEG